MLCCSLFDQYIKHVPPLALSLGALCNWEDGVFLISILLPESYSGGAFNINWIQVPSSFKLNQDELCQAILTGSLAMARDDKPSFWGGFHPQS